MQFYIPLRGIILAIAVAWSEQLINALIICDILENTTGNQMIVSYCTDKEKSTAKQLLYSYVICRLFFGFTNFRVKVNRVLPENIYTRTCHSHLPHRWYFV